MRARYVAGGGILVLLGIVTGIAGCSSSAPSPVPTPPSSSMMPVSKGTSASGPSPSLDAGGQAAVTAYTMMWTTMEADARGGPYSPVNLSAYVTGQPLALFTQNLAHWYSSGIVLKGDFVLRPVVVGETPSGAPTTVQIADKSDDSNAGLYDAKTGARVGNPTGGCELIQATVTDMQGTWRVIALNVGSVGSC